MQKHKVANDNDSPGTRLGLFPLDKGINLQPVLGAPSGRIIHVPWGGGFLLRRE